MNENSCVLPWLTLLPLLGTFLLLPFPDELSKVLSLVISLLCFFLSVQLFYQFDPQSSSVFQKVFSVQWLGQWQIRFALGMDGLNLPLVCLTKLMVPIAILASWRETKKVRALMINILVLDCAMTGSFLATDIFLFFMFWEIMLIPMFFLIGIWGSGERIYTSLKFFLFASAGGLFMLAAILWVYVTHQEQFGVASGQIQAFYNLNFSDAKVIFGLTIEDLVFLAFTVAFAVNTALFPLHSWLPDSQVQTPTGGSILLAAIVLKLGGYGLLRFSIPICPGAFQRHAFILAILGIVGILYGVCVAFRQTDLKKMIAYASVSHLGFVILGICSLNMEALSGSMLQMVNHGLNVGGILLLVGVLFDQRRTCELSEFGGLAKVMPAYAFCLSFVAFANMGIPGLNGFVGQFLILLGSFRSQPIWAGIAVFGLFFGALYTLQMLKGVLFGPITKSLNNNLKDLNARDFVAIIPIILIIVWLGISPGMVIERTEGALQNILARVTERTAFTHLGSKQ